MKCASLHATPAPPPQQTAFNWHLVIHFEYMKGQRKVTNSEEYIKQKDIKQKMQQWKERKKS